MPIKLGTSIIKYCLLLPFTKWSHVSRFLSNKTNDFFFSGSVTNVGFTEMVHVCTDLKGFEIDSEYI